MSPVVYAVDETVPVHPDVSAPAWAAFGVIDLGRSVVWHRDAAALDALHDAAAEPVDRSVLAEAHGRAVIDDLVGRGWLQRPADLCTDYLLTTAQIEVTAHCNWSCAFCPVSLDPKPRATMPMPLFEEIIGKIAPYETIRYVTFHFYNEPTLDRFFTDRVAVLRKHGLKLRLFTNASNLNAEKIAVLQQGDTLLQLVVNLPALDDGSFRDLTGSRGLGRTLDNIEAALDAGLPIELVVNHDGGEGRRRLDELRARFGARGVDVRSTLLSDRAGALEHDYHQNVRIEGRLSGCAWPVNHAHFSVSGDMFICCNDYYQREKFGNIRSGSVHELMTSKEAVLLRRRVFGVSDAPEDYICRTCHDQLPDFPRRQFRPLASFPVKGCRGGSCA
ncbi:radical SAM protein [Actinomadura sp. KC345]|uniref:radical SAM/SPASM domain-containing protein n=1 Tax=Actinomadura sp. KC345 TaxID=2530371 RepID=UPI001A9EF345|nr:radical SAM protein [Actinomadura sp. KC345]